MDDLSEVGIFHMQFMKAAFHWSHILYICCVDFHGGWLCMLVLHFAMPKRLAFTLVADILHHLARRLQSYCSVQNGSSLLSAFSDDRGGRDRLPLTTLLPFDSTTAASQLSS